MRNRRLEKEIRKNVRERVRQSPELRAERARVRRSYRREAPAAIFSLLWLPFLVAYAVADRTPEVSFGFANFWALGLLCSYAGHLAVRLETDPALAYLAHVPLSNQQIFDLQWKRAAIHLIWVVLAHQGALIFTAVLAANGQARYFALLPVILFGHWILIVTGATWLARRRKHPILVAGIFFLLALSLPWLPEKISVELTFLSWFSPQSWVNAPLYFGAIQGRVELVWALAPALLLGALLWRERSAWRNQYEVDPAAQDSSVLQEVVNEQSQRHISLSAQEELIEQWGVILAAKSALVGGWIEQWANRWFTMRQLVIVDVLTGGAPGWTRRWTLAAIILGVTVLSTLVAPKAVGPLIPVAVALAATVGLPLLGGPWLGFETSPRWKGGVQAFYPLGYKEIVVSMLKANTLRFLSFFPLALVPATIAGALMGQPLTGASIACRILLGLWMVQPLLVVFQISRTTNDTARSKLFASLMVILLCLILLAGAGFVLADDWMMAIPFGFPLLILPAMTCWWYGRRWDRGRFDMMPAPNAQPDFL